MVWGLSPVSVLISFPSPLPSPLRSLLDSFQIAWLTFVMPVYKHPRNYAIQHRYAVWVSNVTCCWCFLYRRHLPGSIFFNVLENSPAQTFSENYCSIPREALGSICTALGFYAIRRRDRYLRLAHYHVQFSYAGVYDHRFIKKKERIKRVRPVLENG